MDSPFPDEGALHSMSYTDLKKIAKSRGIKGNMKAKNLIAKLLSVSPDDMESFSTPLQKEVNSSRKNKESKFNEDCQTPLETPRRGTYSVEDDESILSVDVAVTRSPVLDESNITMCRGSERKLRPRKVSFMSPRKATPRTPKYMSLKDRPKTPAATRSGSQQASISTTIGESLKSQKSTQKTPSGKSKPVENFGSNVKSASRQYSVSKLKQIVTPNFQRIHQKAFDKMESIDDYQLRKIKNSAKKLGLKVPQVSKVIKAKSKIPLPFSGIPFIPSVTSCSGLKFNFAPVSGAPKLFTGSQAISTNTLKHSGKTQVAAPSAKGKTKFDLQASLSRKLAYKPYRGPLKPLSESNCMNTPTPACHHRTVKDPLNKVTCTNRSKSRTVLQGVRTNKRFDLQMKNRKIE